MQRVKKARVCVKGREISSIKRGLLLFVGVGKNDTEKDIEYLSKKVINLRIFNDDHGKMNLNIQQVKGQVLSVSQFTLHANTRKGNRPGFDQSAGPAEAKEHWNTFNNLLRTGGIEVREGIFRAQMEIEIINSGPVTIWLDSQEGS